MTAKAPVKKTAKTPTSPAEKRDPTDHERRRAAPMMTRERWEPPSYEAKLELDGRIKIKGPHSDNPLWRAEVLAALGLNSEALAHAVETQLMTLRNRAAPTCQKEVDAWSSELQEGVAFIASLEPRSMLEVTLGIQMWAIHLTTVDMTSRYLRATQLPQFNSYAGLLNKSARTFAAQIDTLTKMRSGGKQTVEVRHVYIDARTQTVVGPQVHGVEAGLSDAPLPPVRGQDATGFVLPGSVDPGEAALQDARGP